MLLLLLPCSRTATGVRAGPILSKAAVAPVNSNKCSRCSSTRWRPSISNRCKCRCMGTMVLAILSLRVDAVAIASPSSRRAILHHISSSSSTTATQVAAITASWTSNTTKPTNPINHMKSASQIISTNPTTTITTSSSSIGRQAKLPVHNAGSLHRSNWPLPSRRWLCQQPSNKRLLLMLLSTPSAMITSHWHLDLQDTKRRHHESTQSPPIARSTRSRSVWPCRSLRSPRVKKCP